METFISTVAYENEFKSHIKSIGWGCGYVHIPKDHPILVQLDEVWGNFLQPEGCPEEITYSEWDKDKEYFVIRFDTTHSYNNSFIHNEIYVTAQANAIKALVDQYTAYDAHAYATKQIQSVAKKYAKYLLS